MSTYPNQARYSTRAWPVRRVTYRRPTSLGNVHVRLVGKGRGKLDIRFLEEGIGPSSCIRDALVRKPWVNIGHAIVHRFKHLRVEVAPRVSVTNRYGLSQVQRGEHVTSVLDPRDKHRGSYNET